MKISLGLLLVLGMGAGLAVAETSEAVLRRVADGVLAQTTRQLIDRTTGETFRDSGNLAAKPEISIESKFNAWFYQTWLLADGMRRAAAVLNEPCYENYGERNLEFIYQNLPYFTRQREAKMKAAPVGDGSLSPIEFHFKLTALWHTGLAPLVMEQARASKDARYEPYLARMDKFLAGNPRFEDGAYFRKDKGMMTDDPYMTVPYLVRRWKQSGDAKPLDAAVAQVLGTHSRLFDPATGLMRHLWSLKTQAPAGEFWGRGNGWMVLAHVELLASLPAAHPRRPEVLAAFVRHMAGIRKFQDPASGGWHQVVNQPESWIETSCTGMFTYGLARGVNAGWLDASFAPAARRGWAALQTKVTAQGDLLDVCGSTDVGDLSYYLKRPRLQGDLHGFGSFLLAGAEILRLEAGLEN
jgi:unsaturated rhamnogalacturonyl hydrolase